MLEDLKEAPTARAGETIPFGDPCYNGVMQFLIEEAQLLDDGLLNDWFGLIAEDMRYEMPIRDHVRRSAGSGFDAAMKWVNDDHAAIAFKVKRYMGTETAWAEDPPSFTRRIVSNLLLRTTATEGELSARTSIMVYRKRGAEKAGLIAAARQDVLRRDARGWKLCHRTVLLDQSVVDMANIAIFL